MELTARPFLRVDVVGASAGDVAKTLRSHTAVDARLFADGTAGVAGMDLAVSRFEKRSHARLRAVVDGAVLVDVSDEHHLRARGFGVEWIVVDRHKIAILLP